MTSRFRLLALAVGAVSLVATGSYVALGVPSTGLRLARDLVLSVITTNTGCTGQDSQCKGLVLGPNQVPSSWPACVDSLCCSLGSCVNAADCCSNMNAICAPEYYNNSMNCCQAVGNPGTPCQNPTDCCNTYFWASVYGTSNNYQLGSPSTCKSGFCEQCSNDAFNNGAAPGMQNAPWAVADCCSGFADNVSGGVITNGHADELCCSNIGEGCNGSVQGQIAYCCGSSGDATLGAKTKPFTECSPYTSLCCILSEPNNNVIIPCTQNSDCCSNDCELPQGVCVDSCSVD